MSWQKKPGLGPAAKSKAKAKKPEEAEPEVWYDILRSIKYNYKLKAVDVCRNDFLFLKIGKSS